MTYARRGEVWLVDFGIPVGREGGYVWQAVVVSSDMPITTSRRHLPLHVEIEPGESGLNETSYARCEDVRSVSVERLVHRFGTLSPETVHQINRTLRYVLEL